MPRSALFSPESRSFKNDAIDRRPIMHLSIKPLSDEDVSGEIVVVSVL